jgi:hypothetical protein
MIEGERLLDEFRDAAGQVGLLDPEVVLRHEHLPAPHRPPSSLPIATSAVYIFSLTPASHEYEDGNHAPSRRATYSL